MIQLFIFLAPEGHIFPVIGAVLILYIRFHTIFHEVL